MTTNTSKPTIFNVNVFEINDIDQMRNLYIELRENYNYYRQIQHDKTETLDIALHNNNAEIAAMDREIGELKRRCSELNAVNVELMEKNTKMSKEFASLYNDYENMREGYENNNDNECAICKELEEEINALKKRINELCQ